MEDAPEYHLESYFQLQDNQLSDKNTTRLQTPTIPVEHSTAN